MATRIIWRDRMQPMAIFTLTDGLWIFAGCSAFWLYGLIGAWIGYRRYETFYAHCEKNDEYWIGCYFITVFCGLCGFLMTAQAANPRR